MSEKIVKETSKEDSAAKKEYIKILEAYKKQNPKKYELKKDAFEKRLASL